MYNEIMLFKVCNKNRVLISGINAISICIFLFKIIKDIYI